MIDFSFHDATPASLKLCAKIRKRWSSAPPAIPTPSKSEIKNRKSQIPMVWTSNFSTGVNTLFWLTRKAAEILGPDFDLEVVEMHHRMKKDAPSGTAKSLAEILADVRKQQLGKSRPPRTQRHRRRTHAGGDRHPLPSRRRCRGRSHGHFCEQRRAARIDAQGVEPRHLRQRRVACGANGS